MSTPEREKVIEKINQTINQIKPYLQADGGDVEIIEITDDYIVKVQLVGSCGSCPFKIHTLKNGVEQALKKEVPQVKEVVSID